MVTFKLPSLFSKTWAIMIDGSVACPRHSHSREQHEDQRLL